MVLVAGCALLSACSSYWQDRLDDAADIFTVTGDARTGAYARVGPFGLGLSKEGWGYGLRGGVLSWNFSCPPDPSKSSCSDWIALGYGQQSFWPEDRWAIVRGKEFVAQSTDQRSEWRESEGVFVARSTWGHSAYYYSQVEIGVGVFFGPRVGVNPGEFLDFVLGWFGVDLYGDDYHSKLRDQLVVEFFDARGNRIQPTAVRTEGVELVVLDQGFAMTRFGHPSFETAVVTFASRSAVEIEFALPPGDGVVRVTVEGDPIAVAEARRIPWGQWRLP